MTLVYSGTVTANRTAWANRDQIQIESSLHMNWNFVYQGPLGVLDSNTGGPHAPNYWTETKVDGFLIVMSYNGLGQDHDDCLASLLVVPASVPLPVVANPPHGSDDASKVGIDLTMPSAGQGVQVEGGVTCEGDPNSYFDIPTAPGLDMSARQPRLVLDLPSGGGQPFEATWDFDLSPKPLVPDAYRIELQSSVTLYLGPATPSP